VKLNEWRNRIKEDPMSNPALAHEFPDDEFERRQTIVEEYIAEENEKLRRETINRAKNQLPYSEPLAIEICERISSGELLINICADEHLPTVRRVTQWLRGNQDFAALYKESINDRLTIFEEEVIKIADDASKDWRDVVRNGRSVRILDGDAIARAKLRVEVRLKHLRAYKPSIWGEQSTLNVKSSDPTDIDNMTSEELAAKIRELDEKDRIVKEPQAA
jgi:hypothetical protein